MACADAPAPATQPASEDAEFIALVQSYFQEPARSKRAAIAARIETTEGATLQRVADALGQVKLWQEQPPGTQQISVQTARPDRQVHVTEVHVRVPEGYDPARAYPLLLGLPGANASAEEYLRFAARLLGDQVDEFLIVSPEVYDGVWLGSIEEESHDLPRLLMELRRAYHIDTDRVYVSGYSLGGHASFSIAALYGDWFAAAVPLAGTFVTQAGWESVELLLPNLRHVPVLAVYGELDRDESSEEGDENSGISGSNRYLAKLLRRTPAPIEFVEIPDVGHDGVVPPSEKFLQLVRRTRPHKMQRIDHRFRYPAQGHAAWLQQIAFQGEVWDSDQIVVMPARDESYSEAVTAELSERLAYLGGRIEGQAIHVQSHRCAKIELLLSGELIDLDKPVEIYLDGTRRYEGSAKPTITTMLEVANEDWDFKRLWPARFELTPNGPARRH